MPDEARLDILISLMTLDEKINCLSTRPSVPRLGVNGTRIVEGLHGLALSGPANWAVRGKGASVTTTFPQAIGLAQMWDPELLRQVASLESEETRWLTHHKYYPDLKTAAKGCLDAGTTMFLDNFRDPLAQALREGLISEAEIDRAIRGTLRVLLKLGLLDSPTDIENPFRSIGIADTVPPWKKDETRELARLATSRSVVLLKNDSQTLPLQKNNYKTIAVIGPSANLVVSDWYSGTPPYRITALQGIRNAVGTDTKILFAASNKADSAVIAAREADVAIVCVENHPLSYGLGWGQNHVASDGREDVDRQALSLEQEDLVKLVHAANRNTILVVVSSFPYTINWSVENIPAIIHISQSSQELGNGLADVIFGEVSPAGQTELPGQKELQEDFLQFRRLLEENHCCLYEYSSKAKMDSLFELSYNRIGDQMRLEEFFRLLAPVTAEIGCMHTATWMPGGFFNAHPENMFPLKIKLIDDQVVVTGSYRDSMEVPRGSILQEINGLPAATVIKCLRTITSADAFNPMFKDAQLTRRFPMFYASYFGFPQKYVIKYALPGRKTSETKTITPATIESVRKVVFAHFGSPPLRLEIIEGKNTALMTVETFIYYDKVDYFRHFMDSSFLLIKEKGIENLILDLRGNGGGDPFCSVILLSYLEEKPVPYFAGSYGRYEELAQPVPLATNHFTGNLYTLIDGSCGSTNGHFCALLRYNGIGKFIGTPSGSTYKCNAGRGTEFTLDNSRIIITMGRGTYAAAVSGMDKRAPIMPDIPVTETYHSFLEKRDVIMERALQEACPNL